MRQVPWIWPFLWPVAYPSGEKKTVGQQAGSRDVNLRDQIRRIKLIEVSEITRQLATLVRAGIPVVEAIGALAEQLENPKLKLVLSDVQVPWGELALGVLVSAVVAYLSIEFFMRFVTRIGLAPFAIYRLALAALIAWMLL